MFGSMLFFEYVYGSKEEQGWYQTIWTEKGKIFQKFFAVIITPLMLIIGSLLYFAYGGWEDMMESPFG